MGTLLFSPSVSFEVPHKVTTWRDDPSFALSPEDFRAAPSREIRQVILHTTRGDGPITPIIGVGPDGSGAESNARYWRKNKKSASAHLVVDYDGSIVQTHYLQNVIAWHAGSASMESVGIECVQGPEPGFHVYSIQAEACAAIIAGLANLGPLTDLRDLGDASCGALTVRTLYDARTAMRRKVAPHTRGVYGHRDVDPKERGENDPGHSIMKWTADVLRSLGFSVVEG